MTFARSSESFLADPTLSFVFDKEKNGDVNEQDLDDHVKRKRKLLVRDWFFYVVWYIRLRKLLVNFYSE